MMHPSRQTGSPPLMRRLNQGAVLDVIREHSPISRAEIAKRLSLNPSTVSRVVDGLLREDLILEHATRGTSTSRGGRRSILLDFNPRSSLIIVLDLSREIMVGALADLDGQILEERQAPSVPGKGGANAQAILELAQHLRDDANALARPVRGLGVGAPSIVLTREGVVVWAASLGWSDFPLGEILQNALEVPVFVENDVNLMALGEFWRGAGKEYNNLVCISMDTGIGAGIILEGRLYRGADEAAGEVGYLAPGLDYLGHRYEELGALEGLAAGRGMVERARTLFDERAEAREASYLWQLVQGDPTRMDASNIFNAARREDPLAREVVEETQRYLALAVSSVASILNPEVIILGGAAARAADQLLEPVRQLIEGVVPVMPLLLPAALGDNAVLMGAVALVQNTTDALGDHDNH